MVEEEHDLSRTLKPGGRLQFSLCRFGPVRRVSCAAFRRCLSEAALMEGSEFHNSVPLGVMRDCLPKPGAATADALKCVSRPLARSVASFALGRACRAALPLARRVSIGGLDGAEQLALAADEDDAPAADGWLLTATRY